MDVERMVEALEYLKEARDEMLDATYKLEGVCFALEGAVKNDPDLRLRRLYEKVEKMLDEAHLVRKRILEMIDEYERILS